VAHGKVSFCSSGLLIYHLLVQAPGEAEAELATMSQLNRIDAVFTSDSDALVFGARCVIRRYESAFPFMYILISLVRQYQSQASYYIC
jgi:5'-3' exonuclease